MTLPMEKATYRARAVGAGFGIASTGNTQVSITFALLAEDDVMTEEEITWTGTFADTVMKSKNGSQKTVTQRTLESLLYMGFTSDDLSLLEEPSREEVMGLLPNAVDIEVDVEQYEGRDRLKVQWVNRPNTGFAFKQPLKGNDMKAFAAQMKGTLRNMRGPVAPSAPASRSAAPAPRNGSGGSGPTRHPNAPGGTDDIPF